MAQKKPPKLSYRARQPAPQPREAKPTYAEQTQRQVRGKARGRDNKSKKIIWIVLIFIFIAFILLNYEGGILMKASDAVRTGISSMGGGAGFPYDINADKVKGLGYYQGNLLALTDNNVTVLSASAKEIKNTNHGFANPTSVVAGGRVLTYDQGGTRLMVENSNRKVFEKTYDSPILFAALGDDGSFAVATGSKQASSEVTVYSRNIKEAFTWRSSNSYIMNCAVSNNGKYLSVATVTAKDGILVSNVLTFDIKAKKLLETASFGSSVIAGLHYSSGNRLTVVGDDVLSVITNQKKRTDLLKPDEQRMTAMDIAPNQGMAVVYGKFDNSQTSHLTYVTKTGTKKFTSEINGVVSAVSAGNNYIALLVGNSVLVYNMKGQCVNTIPLTTDAIRLQVIGSKLYLQTYTQITVCSANKGGTKK